MHSEQGGSIDSAIEALENYIESNRRAGKQIMMYLVAFSMVIVMAFSFPFLTTLDQSQAFLYILAGIFVVVFGVLMAVYRFHLSEIAKAEHSKIGFMRIRVAANNYDKDGFTSEVRCSLTEKAFEYVSPSLISGRAKSVESPLPGHPTADMSAILLNKLLEGLEVRKKS